MNMCSNVGAGSSRSQWRGALKGLKGLNLCDEVGMDETGVAYVKSNQDDFVTTGKLIREGPCDEGIFK